ncbi:MAG: PEP-CTERM sorting domain-containing protein [Acidobacteriota bacterium]|nr:PEP-CTERM sorting domain-containing protein [Acidobacteriota bacterium]
MIINKYFFKLVVTVVMLLATVSAKADTIDPITVASTVSLAGTNFLYDFAITNNSSMDPLATLISVDFSLPLGSIVGDATAPFGFGASTDPSGNFVEFTSNSISGFAVGMTVGGFEFVSPLKFTSFPFTANYLDSGETTLTTLRGSANVSPGTSSVPEPGTLGLLAAGAALLLSGRFRCLRVTQVRP